MRFTKAVAVGLVLIGGLWVSTQDVSPQTSTGLPTVTHVGVVVPDIDAALRGYAEIFGTDVPEVNTVQVPLPDGSQAPTKRAVVPMPGFHIEVLEPEGTTGPLYEHLQKHGLGLHQIGFTVEGDVDEVRDSMIAKGGTLTAVLDGVFAYLDFTETLGTTIEIQPADANLNDPPTPGPQTGLFGGRPISHVGFAVRDVDAAVAAWVDILGVEPVQPFRFPPQPGPFPFPPGMWNTGSHVRVATMRVANAGLEMIEPVGGPNPWTYAMDKQGGNALQHIAVGRGEMDRDEWLRRGEAMGGKWTNGGPNGELGGFAYLDFTETLGLIIE